MIVLAALLAFPPTLMYHRVDVSSPSDRVSQKLTISPAQFASELRAIADMKLETIGVAELARNLAERTSMANTVVLTFDDGYSDQYTYAFPLLRRFDDRAIFFVNTGTIGTAGHLTWAQVEAMARAGMSIECHGVRHLDLSVLGRPQQSYQIDRCIHDLTEHLHLPVLAYAYPSGAFDGLTVALERRAGILLGFTTDPRFRTDAVSPYQIARVRVLNGMSDEWFASRLRSGHGYVSLGAAPAP